MPERSAPSESTIQGEPPADEGGGTRSRRLALLAGVALLGTACNPFGGEEAGPDNSGPGGLDSGSTGSDDAPNRLALNEVDAQEVVPLGADTLDPEDLSPAEPVPDGNVVEDTASPASDSDGNAGPRNDGPLVAEPRTPATTTPTTAAPSTTAPPTTVGSTTSAPATTAVSTTAVSTTAVSTTLAATSTTAAAAPTTAAPTTTEPSTTSTAPTTTTPTTTAPPPPPPPAATARLVTGRLTYAPTPDTDAAVLALGLNGWIEDQLAKSGPDPTVEGELASYQSHGVTFQQLRSQVANGGDTRRTVQRETFFSDIYRGRYSEHQLYEMVTKVWYDHFNINFPGDGEAHLVSHYQESVIRPNAMGRFADLLRATAESPAMMRYLDNYRSDARRGINENYGRELLELHSLGIDQNGVQIYTEADVVGASHVMSGWSVVTDRDASNRDEFLYRPEYHSTEPVSLLDGQWTNAGLNGKDAGDSLLEFLAHHPQTAQYVSYKLARRFVADRPSQALIESAAAVYLANDTAIVPVLRHIISSADFAASNGAKVRRPTETVVAALRTLGVTVPIDPNGRGSTRFRDRVRDMNHQAWSWETPDGHPDIAEPWVNADGLLRRWNLTSDIARERHTDSRRDDHMPIDAVGLVGASATAGELFARLANRANLGTLPEATRDQLLNTVGLTAESAIDEVSDNDLRDLLSFLLSHPFFQLR